MDKPTGSNSASESNPPSRQPDKPTKDLWDKLDVVAKISLPLVMGMLGFLFNYSTTKKQDMENNIKLYTQLLSDKETAENTLRKDMFSKILESFIGDREKNQGGIDRIKEMRLSLELLSRNFHESLDMKPLFRHLLMEIITQSVELRKAKRQLREALAGGDTDGRLRNAVQIARSALGTHYRSQSQVEPASSEVASTTDRNPMLPTGGTSPLRAEAVTLQETVTRELSRYDTELRELTGIARRVARKQREVLEDVAQTIKISFNRQDRALQQVNMGYKPTEPLPPSNAAGNRGIVSEKRLAFRDITGKEIAGSARHFRIVIRYAYPKWRQIHMEVTSWPCLGSGSGDCAHSDRDAPRVTSAFWLDQFDFPLVDNTFIDSGHRYSAVLDDLDVGADEEIENAAITLLYYPASYAGLKEKAFYNNQLLHNLLKWNMFNKE